MKARTAAIKRLWKAVLLVAAVAAAIVSFAQDAPSASAQTGTSIILSDSATSPTPAAQIILYPGGPSKTLYVWAVNVKDTQGAGAWEIQFDFQANLVSVSNLNSDTAWLVSSGRTSVTCLPSVSQRITQDPVTGEGHAQVGCHTLNGAPPPFGPNCANGHCSGLLASFVVTPLLVTPPQTAYLNFQLLNGNPLFTYHTVLVDTGVGPPNIVEPQEIRNSGPLGEVVGAVPVPNASVMIPKCADINGNGTVSLLPDIIPIILRFGMTSIHPDWDASYDLNNDNKINLLGDILAAILQFGQSCTQP